MGIRAAIPLLFLMVIVGTVTLLAGIAIFLSKGSDVGGTLTHEEYMRLSSGEAHGLRICQREEIFAQMERRYGGPPGHEGRDRVWKAKAWKEYNGLMKVQQREGQPTMPKFVDPGDPPSFQETMWKKGHKCQGADWQDFVSE